LPDLIQGRCSASSASIRHREEVALEVTALLRDLEQAGRLVLECAPNEADELQRLLVDFDAIPDGSRWTLQAQYRAEAGRVFAEE